MKNQFAPEALSEVDTSRPLDYNFTLESPQFKGARSAWAIYNIQQVMCVNTACTERSQAFPGKISAARAKAELAEHLTQRRQKDTKKKEQQQQKSAQKRKAKVMLCVLQLQLMTLCRI